MRLSYTRLVAVLWSLEKVKSYPIRIHLFAEQILQITKMPFSQVLIRSLQKSMES